MDYYVNRQAQANGDHEVHRSDCAYLPSESNRIHLGTFSNCRDAIREARKHFSQVDGCYFCSRECHTG